MDSLKEIVLTKMEKLHIKLYYKNHYSNSQDGVFERLKDTIKYEQLKELVKENPEWNNEEFSLKLSKRIHMNTSLY